MRAKTKSLIGDAITSRQPLCRVSAGAVVVVSLCLRRLTPLPPVNWHALAHDSAGFAFSGIQLYTIA